jgi:hypothetical protein
MHPQTPPADRAICEAAAKLDNYILTFATARKDLAALRLPLPAAEDKLDHIDDLLAIVCSLLNRAGAIMGDAVETIRRADDARYDGAANDDGPFEPPVLAPRRLA